MDNAIILRSRITSFVFSFQKCGIACMLHSVPRSLIAGICVIETPLLRYRPDFSLSFANHLKASDYLIVRNYKKSCIHSMKSYVALYTEHWHIIFIRNVIYLTRIISSTILIAIDWIKVLGNQC